MRTSQGLRHESELRAFDVSCLQRKQVMLGAIQEISMPHALRIGQLSYHLRRPLPCARPRTRRRTELSSKQLLRRSRWTNLVRCVPKTALQVQRFQRLRPSACPRLVRLARFLHQLRPTQFLIHLAYRTVWASPRGAGPAKGLYPSPIRQQVRWGPSNYCPRRLLSSSLPHLRRSLHPWSSGTVRGRTSRRKVRRA